jgi:protein-L-isoaspartate O-methyltransferase
VGESQPPPAFFDRYPRFYETGNTRAGSRLNARHECLIARHTEHLRDRTVLDVGSHDGRWSFAALAAGARHVLGVETRPALVEATKKTFAEYQIAPERFAFHVGDILEFLNATRPTVDTVLLCGVLYHVHYHVALLQELRQTGARTILIDTIVVPRLGAPPRPEEVQAFHRRTPPMRVIAQQENAIHLIVERVDDFSNAAAETFPGSGCALVGIPSYGAVVCLLEAFGFETEEVSWEPYLKRWGVRGLEDYAKGERATFLARR